MSPNKFQRDYLHVYANLYVFTHLFAWAVCDTRSIIWVFNRFEFKVFLLDQLPY